MPMKIRDINQKNKNAPNIVAKNIKGSKIETTIYENSKSPKKERIVIKDNSILHNLNLQLYGFLFKRFGFLKTGIGFGITGLASVSYLFQAFYLNWFQQGYVNAFFIFLLIYSVYYFQFFFNKKCHYCKKEFSLVKKGTYKIGECKIKGVPHDINEIEYNCNSCKKKVFRQYREAHEGYSTQD